MTPELTWYEYTRHSMNIHRDIVECRLEAEMHQIHPKDARDPIEMTLV